MLARLLLGRDAGYKDKRGECDVCPANGVPLGDGIHLGCGAAHFTVSSGVFTKRLIFRAGLIACVFPRRVFVATGLLLAPARKCFRCGERELARRMQC